MALTSDKTFSVFFCCFPFVLQPKCRRSLEVCQQEALFTKILVSCLEKSLERCWLFAGRTTTDKCAMRDARITTTAFFFYSHSLLRLPFHSRQKSLKKCLIFEINERSELGTLLIFCCNLWNSLSFPIQRFKVWKLLVSKIDARFARVLILMRHF